jgi:hypothetical protein
MNGHRSDTHAGIEEGFAGADEIANARAISKRAGAGETAGVDGDGAGQGAFDAESAVIDEGGAGEVICAGEGEGAGTGFGDAAGAADRVGDEGAGVVAADEEVFAPEEEGAAAGDGAEGEIAAGAVMSRVPLPLVMTAASPPVEFSRKKMVPPSPPSMPPWAMRRALSAWEEPTK